MQGAWADRFKRIIKIAIPILVLGLCVLLDQLSKVYFKDFVLANGNIIIIPNFFYFTYTVNTGAAWSFLADVSWGQLFFKILTGVALVAFIGFLVFSLIKGYKWLSYSFAFIIGGTIGNFIDRLAFNGVTDFIGFTFGSYNFPIFNLADSFLVVGMIMLIVYFAFIDKNALFRKKKKEETLASLNENADKGQDQACESNGDKEISDN